MWMGMGPRNSEPSSCDTISILVSWFFFYPLPIHPLPPSTPLFRLQPQLLAAPRAAASVLALGAQLMPSPFPTSTIVASAKAPAQSWPGLPVCYRSLCLCLHVDQGCMTLPKILSCCSFGLVILRLGVKALAVPLFCYINRKDALFSIYPLSIFIMFGWGTKPRSSMHICMYFIKTQTISI